MRQPLSRFAVAAGLLLVACATAIDNSPPLDGDPGAGDTSGSGGALSVAGSMVNNTSGSTSAGSSSMPTSGSATGGSGSSTGGSSTNAFGGTATTGGSSKGGSNATAGTAAGGTASGGTGGKASGGAAGTSTGGKGGSGGSAGSAGSAAGGKGGGGSSGSANGGSGTAGSTSTTCNGVADWSSSKTYAVSDTVADTCTGVFAGSCTMGQHHKFECNPPAGAGAVLWCMEREPGVGNGWQEAWVDKGQCQ